MSDIIVRYIKLPLFVKGQVVIDENDDYNIYINTEYPIDVQQKTLAHELRHVRNTDFECAQSIAEIENI